MAKELVTYEQLRRSARTALKDVGIESADLDCRILLMKASGLDPSSLIAQANENVPENVKRQFNSMLARRLEDEPIAYIVGEQEFWSLLFAVNSDVLIPRPETEGVVECALALLNDVKAPVIVDIGTGSGAILLSLLHERQDATGIGLDISSEALDIARHNADRLGLSNRAEFKISNYLENVTDRVDLIVSNPPYITDQAMIELPDTVASYEPHLALSGGDDGLVAYRTIISGAPDRLVPGGFLVFEIGYDQGKAVAELLRQAGLVDICVHKDLAGHDRVVSGKLSV